MTKAESLRVGQQHISLWCKANSVTVPEVRAHWDGTCPFGVCAYRREELGWTARIETPGETPPTDPIERARRIAYVQGWDARGRELGRTN